MNSCCLIMDMDGVMNGRTFFAREVGFAPLNPPRIEAFHVRYELPDDVVLSMQDLRSADWVRRNHSGITVVPMRGERPLRPQSHLREHVWRVWQQYATPGQNVVAYKGNHHVKELLKSMDIPSLNLEMFGCPKYERIRLPLYQVIPSCGFHTNTGRAVIHCAKLKAHVFRVWWSNATRTD